MMRGARIGKKDRPNLDPFSVQDAETLIAALRRSPTVVASEPAPRTPVSHVVPGNFLTGARTEFDRLTIRVRVDTSALDVADLKAEIPPQREPAPAPEPKRKRRTGKKSVSKKQPKPGKLLKTFRNTGGADGRRRAL